jgi:hypothetical protein
VTVVDDTAPLLTAPAPITRGTGPGATLAGVVIADLGHAIATDNCAIVSVTVSGVPSGDFFPIGTTRVTYTALDTNGNTTSAGQSVTVIDDTPPTISAPPDVTPFTGAGATGCATFVSAAVLGSPIATDNSGGSVQIAPTLSGALFPVGTTTVTYTATDPSGNSATATQRVTVIDNTSPLVTAPGNVIRAATGVATLISDADLGSASASDNCGPVTVARSGVPAGNLFPHGTTTLTYSATDAAGNTATATQAVTVTPTTASVCAVARSFVGNAGVANSLCAKLDAAAAAQARGNMNAHDNVIDAFVRHVNALRHAWLDDAQADQLIGFVGGL